ncbi:MAG: aspartate aminotransferase family protein [Acidobacteria bacterium]|nr:MAG: aspartate aminotransferase family protein [Acidobacteriota bacterium]PYQ18634.1 MAG: aspartate aminotransferase family protein [Acidobacteriota bacterium]
MALNVDRLFLENLPQKFDLADRYFNPTFVQALKIIGLDKPYQRAQGCYVYDADGHRYLDFLSGYRVLNLGHNHPVVRQALADALMLDWPNMLQMDASPLSAALARELVRRAPAGLELVRFGNSGSEAVEMAMKFSRRATGRSKLLAAESAYHGLTYGALSLSGQPEMWQPGFRPVVPDCGLVPFNDVAALETMLRNRDVAAFIVEPIQGEAGIVVPSDDYLPRAQELCRAHGTLFVLDEVQTGLGRTGKFLAAEHWNLEPDMICLAKALSGGFVPVSATLMRRSIFLKVFDNIDNCVIHFSTFEANNLAMVAGLATLHVLDSEGLVENSARLGALLLERLKELQRRHEFIAEVRGRGLFVAVRFGTPRTLQQKMSWKLARETAEGFFGQCIVMALMKHHRIITQTAGHDPDVLDCTPPLVATEAEVDYFVNALDQVLQGCKDVLGPVWEMGTDLMKRSMENGVALPSLQRAAAGRPHSRL